tara:strand:+ start:640 stop:810 length:171 start_codon:yes stop_codon:yes gene_type:complete
METMATQFYEDNLGEELKTLLQKNKWDKTVDVIIPEETKVIKSFFPSLGLTEEDKN